METGTLLSLSFCCFWLILSSIVVGYFVYKSMEEQTTDQEEIITETQSSSQQTPISSKPSEWKCLPNIYVPLRKNAQGDIECMSTNNKDCAWKSNNTECQALLISPVTPLNPLACGTMHNEKYGSTGYNNPDHWCSKGKLQLI